MSSPHLLNNHVKPLTFLSICSIAFLMMMAHSAPQPDMLPYLASIHRGQLAISRMLRELTYATPELNMMFATKFDEYVAWPVDQSRSIREGGVAADDNTDEEKDDDSEESDNNFS